MRGALGNGQRHGYEHGDGHWLEHGVGMGIANAQHSTASVAWWLGRKASAPKVLRSNPGSDYMSNAGETLLPGLLYFGILWLTKGVPAPQFVFLLVFNLSRYVFGYS